MKRISMLAVLLALVPLCGGVFFGVGAGDLLPGGRRVDAVRGGVLLAVALREGAGKGGV